MLQYLVKLVRGNYPDLLGVHGDMVSVDAAQHVIIGTLDSELEKMAYQLSQVKEITASEGKKIRQETETPLSSPSLEALLDQNATTAGVLKNHTCDQRE